MKLKTFIVVIITLSLSTITLAVTSVVTRHRSGRDFSKGTTEKVIVDSAGTLRLARQSTELDCADLLDDVWSIHAVITDQQGAFYLATGPDAKVIRYMDQQAELVYPLDITATDDADTSIRNEHVFALTQDLAGRLLIAVSGQTGKLVRLNPEPETVFEDDRVQYIFAIAKDQASNIYLGTGPQGLVFRLNPFCKDAQVVYDAEDKSILSLALSNDGDIIYAGGDERGLVYKIDPDQKQASVLYDSDQDEVPVLWVDSQGEVYAATTNAQAAMLQLKAGSKLTVNDSPGRPDGDSEQTPSDSADMLNTANNDESEEKEKEKSQAAPPVPPVSKVAGHIYKISPDGFVTDIFSEVAVFYTLLQADDQLWLGTGNKCQLFAVNPATEEKSIVFEDKNSLQITAAVEADGAVYMGLSNPAKFIKLKTSLEASGTYDSELIDAGQPARWGKLQIEAEIPEGCQIKVASRSGNVKEPNDPTFSDWSEESIITEATDLNCPIGRFCQYRLSLVADGDSTPVIRQVTAAHSIPNMAPIVTAVQVQRSRDKKTPYNLELKCSVKDDNRDDLEYTLEFRKSGRNVWIPLKDELDQPRYEWDSRTIEDGRYEVRVTANDRKSNTPETMLTGVRVSDVFVIDNTAPEISDFDMTIEPGAVRAELIVTDALSVLESVKYTVDSNEKWITALPKDMIYDTLSESFTVQVEDLSPGDHVIAFSVTDDVDNTRFQTYEITIP